MECLEIVQCRTLAPILIACFNVIGGPKLNPAADVPIGTSANLPSTFKFSKATRQRPMVSGLLGLWDVL